MPAGPRGKGVTWEELFFDLAFVFALTQFSELLHEDHGWPGIGRALILFVPVYWATAGRTGDGQCVRGPAERRGDGPGAGDH
ncbi:low temperature requirement protein A [Micromonospora krabiensis]|uniref:Low temperature requirement A protein (LtrA) n=1 Tax=Micromonospora krabiensis TaxID=307121 RepID=A0A1C3MYA9_9ACTN|nr:low temperature requirement protein A [Micromonospora krabiensis]SBV25308.1 low temperature requirement A protein (LtrA) [Micromonospora krabiensis]